MTTSSTRLGEDHVDSAGHMAMQGPVKSMASPLQLSTALCPLMCNQALDSGQSREDGEPWGR